ncbi:MAG: universal stress protein [Bryobacteraceae bacterium]|jgi:nucleotide-binding universal stress UspA family protein
MFEKILVAHDGSDGAQKAFDAAVDLASRLQASLHMISVEEDLPRYAETTMGEIDEVKEEEDTYFGQLAAQAKRRAALHSVPLEYSIVAGHEVKAIIDFATQGGFDLLVVGFTGHSAAYEHLWGGTSHNLTRMAHCSVLVVK